MEFVVKRCISRGPTDTMCGISGIFHYEADRPVDHEVLRRMADSLRHRGPDGEGFFANGPVGLAHRRLAIIDLQTGDQPMLSRDGELAVVFNGEIYNYIELRDELKGFGHVFNTVSDTEVLLRAYEQWGLGMHDKLNGMWAFALWDGKAKRLLLSRDRLGEKPLHYAQWDKSFLFGSEIKSLLAYGLPKEPEASVLELYLTLGYVPSPFSFYKRVRKLRPGHYLLVQDGRCEERRFWDLPLCEEANMRRDAKAVEEEFQFLLADSVRLRMRSDVSYGAFLSGGLDSSSIVALMAEKSDRPVESFTVGFDERGFDERSLARAVAERFQTNHHEEVLRPDAFEESMARVLFHCDEPFGDSSAIPTGQVSGYARKSVKMVLTGDGGDEVLSGYNAYQSEKLAARIGRWPRTMNRLASRALSLASKASVGGVRFKLKRLSRVLATSGGDFGTRLLAKTSWLDPAVVRELIGAARGDIIRADEFLEDFMKPCPYRDGFYRMMFFQTKLSLPEDMLVKVDRMSMAYGLETRVPFLDHRLVELMAGGHKDVKMRGYERKSVLRRTVGRKLPKATLQAPKQGFTVPVREWFKGSGMAPFLEALEKRPPFGLNPRAMGSIISENREGAADHGNFLWMCCLLQHWTETRTHA